MRRRGARLGFLLEFRRLYLTVPRPSPPQRAVDPIVPEYNLTVRLRATSAWHRSETKASRSTGREALKYRTRRYLTWILSALGIRF
jgi:hypothetical protein